jgi:hypothetical protein
VRFGAIFPQGLPRETQGSVMAAAPGTVRGVLVTIQEAAERLRVHRSTIYRLAHTDPTFPPLLYIRPRCPRIKVTDLDRWCARQAPMPNHLTVPAELLGARRRLSKKQRLNLIGATR